MEPLCVGGMPPNAPDTLPHTHAGCRDVVDILGHRQPQPEIEVPEAFRKAELLAVRSGTSDSRACCCWLLSDSCCQRPSNALQEQQFCSLAWNLFLQQALLTRPLHSTPPCAGCLQDRRRDAANCGARQSGHTRHGAAGGGRWQHPALAAWL